MEIPTIAVTSTILVDGREVVVVDISTSATLEGRSVIIRALDKDSAEHYQEKKLESESIPDIGVILKRLFGGGA